jgi:hypothetical protein
MDTIFVKMLKIILKFENHNTSGTRSEIKSNKN